MDHRIVIDALSARSAGIAYATVEIAHHLADDPAIGEVVLVARDGSTVMEEAQQKPTLRLFKLPPGRPGELARRIVWEGVALPRLVSAPSTSVLSCSGMLPRRLPVPVTSVLSNSVVFQDNDPTNLARRWAVHRAAGWAAHLIVPTEAMADIAAESLGRRPDVIPRGVDRGRFRPAPTVGNQVLYVADFYPHKRHDVALAAWAALPEPRPTLRLIGDRGVHGRHSRGFSAAVDRDRHLGEIVIEGGLKRDALVSAYHQARALMITSDRESFCNPLIEAQACGVPAVVRDIPVLRETGGEGTTYVDGDDPGAWSAALLNLLHDDEAHARARSLGLEHAAKYSWEDAAAATRDRLLDPA